MKQLNFLPLLLMITLFVTTSCFSQSPDLNEELFVPTTSPTAAVTTNNFKDKVLTILYWDAPTTLNIHLTNVLKDFQVSRITYEPLASFNKDGVLIPILAAEIPSIENKQVASDGKFVIWKLKQNIKWSDGEPFTADDVKFTYDFITNPDVGAFSASAYEAISTIEVVDSYTVKVIFKRATPNWALPFVGIGGVILPKHVFEPYNNSKAQKAPANILPIGTGPYRVVAPGIKPQEIIFLGTQLIQTNKIVFEPNPYYRDKDKLYFSRIEIRGGGTANEAARQVLKTGEADYAWNLTIAQDELKSLAKNGIGQVVANFGSKVDEIDVNQTDPNKATEDGERSSLQFPHPFFQDLRVRQAFAHAIDREAILKLYDVTGELTHQLLASPPQYKSGTVFYEFDLKKATALLDEAGWVDSDNDGIRDKNGVKMAVLFQTTANPIRQETQRIVKTNLEKIGVDVQIKIIDASIFYSSDLTHPDNSQQFQADLQEQDWTNPGPDPGLFLQYWTCSQATQKANGWSGYNNPRWCNKEYDTLYAQSQTELDPTKRTKIFSTMNDLITSDVALIPLVRQASISALNQKLVGFDYTPWDAETWNIQDWKLKD